MPERRRPGFLLPVILLISGTSAICAPESSTPLLWKLTPLHTGICWLGEDHVLGESHSPEKRLPFVLYSFLAEGPGGEVVLVDLGPKSLEYTNDMFRRYGFFRESDGSRSRPDDIVQVHGNVFVHLARRGIRPEMVRHIIFTHLHADHHGMDTGKNAGAAADFPRAIFHASKTGWERNLAKRNPEGGWASYVDFPFSDFLLSMGEKGRCVFEDNAEILPGIRTLYLGGHSPCSQAVVVETAQGPAILTSDEVYHYRLLEEGFLARLHTSPEKLISATDRLAALALSRKGILIPVHDPEVWNAFQKAGDRWLSLLKPLSERAVKGYQEHRRKGTLKRVGAARKASRK